MFWPWEAATGAPASAMPGLVKPGYTLLLTLLGSTALAMVLWPVFGLWGLPLALALGRLMALDLTTHTLPNVYTLPLLAVGLAHGLAWGDMPGILAALIVLVVYTVVGWVRPDQSLLGGGDLKLLAAMFAGLGAPLTCWAVAAGCIMWLPVAFWKPRAAQPLGVPLVLGGVLMAFAAPFIL